MRGVNGLHHVTAISGPAQENLDFYAGVLGMRLVKRSVNQDDPGTYHLFYADAEGHAGTDLTFFPWAHMAPSRDGHGLATEVSLAVPADTLDWWGARLTGYGATARPSRRSRRGSASGSCRSSTRTACASRWSRPRPPSGAASRRGTPARCRPSARSAACTARASSSAIRRPPSALLTGAMGFVPHATEGDWQRFVDPRPGRRRARASSGGLLSGVSGRHLDVCARPDARRGAWGTGSIHHLAWRVDDDAHEAEMRSRVADAGAHPTPVIDRFWFKSVYFKEPGGVLFELATDGPGFAVDEAAHALGESLVLPPWLETQRSQIQAILPVLSYPPALPAARSRVMPSTPATVRCARSLLPRAARHRSCSLAARRSRPRARPLTATAPRQERR